VLPVLDAGHDLSFCGIVARQLVRDHDPRRTALLPQQLAQQTLGGLLVTPALDEDVQHDPVLVHSAPEPVFLARDRQHDLIKVPLVSGCGQTAPDLVGKVLPKLQRPLPPVDPLRGSTMADHDAAGGEELVHIAQAERETEVEPDRVADDLAWEAIAGVAGKDGRRHPGRLRDPVRPGKLARHQLDGALCTSQRGCWADPS